MKMNIKENEWFSWWYEENEKKNKLPPKYVSSRKYDYEKSITEMISMLRDMAEYPRGVQDTFVKSGAGPTEKKKEKKEEPLVRIHQGAEDFSEYLSDKDWQSVERMFRKHDKCIKEDPFGSWNLDCKWQEETKPAIANFISKKIDEGLKRQNLSERTMERKKKQLSRKVNDWLDGGRKVNIFAYYTPEESELFLLLLSIRCEYKLNELREQYFFNVDLEKRRKLYGLLKIISGSPKWQFFKDHLAELETILMYPSKFFLSMTEEKIHSAIKMIDSGGLVSYDNKNRSHCDRVESKLNSAHECIYEVFKNSCVMENMIFDLIEAPFIKELISDVETGCLSHMETEQDDEL